VETIVGTLGDGSALPHPSALALTEISESLLAVGDMDAAVAAATHAEEIAKLRGFHQILYRLENPRPIAAPAPLAPATSKIIEAVDELEGAELVGA
jgi:hypothetical protein